MIDIRRKEDCVGCRGCVQACPKDCISFDEDAEGFRYPKVDLALCIQCGLCERVCPVIHRYPPRLPEKVYAAKNRDSSVQSRSSSGGVFAALAAEVISEGGVVFGARFDSRFEAVHDFAETFEGIERFIGSKYLQSRMGDCYSAARKFLKEGRRVMFSGTPCQIAGLARFLRKDYGSQLIKVDIACHAVPSPKVWRDYLSHIAGDNEVRSVSFRDKRDGWSDYGLSIDGGKAGGETRRLFFEPHSENLYMRGFLSDIFIRPSCFECPAKRGRSSADITLGDFWGLSRNYPLLYARGLYSLLLVNSETGMEAIKKAGIEMAEAEYKIAVSDNKGLETSPCRSRYTSRFWSLYKTEGIEAIPAILNAMRPSLPRRAWWWLRTFFKGH